MHVFSKRQVVLLWIRRGGLGWQPRRCAAESLVVHTTLSSRMKQRLKSCERAEDPPGGGRGEQGKPQAQAEVRALGDQAQAAVRAPVGG